MHSRSAVNLAVAVSLVALLGAGCSRSGDSKPKDAAVAGTRPIAAIWADVLTQRDQIHLVFIKDLEEVSHADCDAVGASARRIDELYSELVNHIGATSQQGEGQLRAVGDAATRASAVITKVRETALAESPGAWVSLRFPLDQSLRELETYFSPDDLGQESVMNRPGFEAKPPAAAPSAI